MTDSNVLVATLEAFASRASEKPLNLGEVSDGLGGSSFSLLCAILSLPLLSPLSLGPLATAGGLTLAVLGWQILREREAPSLPQRVRNIEMSARVWQGLLTACLKIVRWCQRFSRPRYQEWVEGRRGVRMRGGVILAAGLLMAVPLFGLPLNNALPALAILLACIAELEDDGLLAWLSVLMTVVSAVYILGVLIAVALLGTQVVINVFQ